MPPPTFLGAIDQNTTSTRFLIFSKSGDIICQHEVKLKQIYPHPGWHEQEPEELAESVEHCINEAVKSFEEQGHLREQIAAVGLTNQGATTVVWDRETGKPLYNAIVWTDTRHWTIIRQLKGGIGAGEVPARCGLPLSTYPSIGKFIWLLKNVPEVQMAYMNGRLVLGTINSWLTFKLNGGISGNVYVTDSTNASRTMLLNIETLEYDEKLIDWFGIDGKKILLPKIVRCADATAFGKLATGALKDVRITGCLTNQSAALVGQKRFSQGMVTGTYDVECSVSYNCGPRPVISSCGLLSTVAFDFGKDNLMYALAGIVGAASSSVKFLIENLELAKSSQQVGALAETVEDNGGCAFVTAFSGLFAPYWIGDARGTLFGITPYTKKGHIARATIEACGFQTRAILDAICEDRGHSATELDVNGTMSSCDLIMQVSSTSFTD